MPRKNSSEEEFDDFKSKVNNNLEIQSHSLDDEILLTDRPAAVTTKKEVSEVYEETSKMDFSSMQKVGSLTIKQYEEKEEEETEGDLDDFMTSFSRQKFRQKYSKVRSDEHSDRSNSSSEDTDSDEGGDDLNGEMLYKTLLPVVYSRTCHL